MTARERQGPLDGLRVIDMSGMISGTFATTMMGDFGADVVMVEHPEVGDPIREWPQKTENGISLAWKSIGRNKRCITLDLGSDRGREIALDLIAEADVLFENFRPGTMERWGLGPEDVHAVNEEAIMVRLSGYGQTGPKSQKPVSEPSPRVSRAGPTPMAFPTANRSCHPLVSRICRRRSSRSRRR